ncbi:MOSC domain-containing protein [Geodermatophilus sp. DF01-2]|uniref:MOSC domain-containing protein n=1 Tax=Geodermatophilus sp. DF01-2 TaxID=2559610 RepID=UPI001072F639|nr:MOSC N-terminal beta barrel domain-containing protein [Geodermatophilus sp. DF01_2]TFV57569.1 MOSC domain-containing protein [Geodermatophilus sp. DF01_2]
MRIAELWRYPVKSLQGERLTGTEVGPEGLSGDRQWALFDLGTGYGLTARRVPQLLFASGRLRPDGAVEVVLPDGSVTSDDAVLSAWLGRPVELRAAADAPGERRYENPAGVGEEDEYDWDAFTGARGAFHDSSRTRVSLVSTGTLGTWDRRRFRANVLLDGEGEDALVGHQVRLGGVELDVVKQVDRCVMVTRPQPGGIGRDTAVLKTIHRQRDGFLAIGALVARAGRVAVGDELTAGG